MVGQVTPPETQVVLFVDLLGFASLTERYALDQQSLLRAERLFALDLNDIVRVQDNNLTRTFHSFHHTVKAALDRANMRHPLTAITFSDSAFIATSRLNDAANIAIEIAGDLLVQHVPVRMAIASGSFAALRFRSDVTSEGGDHAAHFLGTAVVRAYAAERCGIKGIRLLLHPTAVELAGDPSHTSTGRRQHEWRFVECSRAEVANSVGVGHEIDFWRFAPTREARAWHALQDMWDAASTDVKIHYSATAAAINRMRVAQGERPLNNLRRRTLPRTKHP